MCRSKKLVREVLVNDDSQDSQDEFLGVIHSETDSLSSTEAPWTTNLELNGRNIEFKIDTGADVTVISEQEYLSKQDGPLTQTNRVLSGPSQQKLDVRGQTFQISSSVHSKRFMLSVAFAKHYWADQLLNPYKMFNKLNPYRQTVLSNNFQNFSKGLED